MAADTSNNCLIVFFHGHGSSGAEMERIMGATLRSALPHATLVFPDGPIKWTDENNNSYHSWFDVSDVSGKNPDSTLLSGRARIAAQKINQELDQLIAKTGIPEDRVILGGFSQGGTIAFYTGLTRASDVGGVFSLSGGALDKLDNPTARPPVALHTGDQETNNYCGVPQVQRTQYMLDQKGFKTDCVIIPDNNHEINAEVLHYLVLFTKIVTAENFQKPKKEAPSISPANKNNPPGFKTGT